MSGSIISFKLKIEQIALHKDAARLSHNFFKRVCAFAFFKKFVLAIQHLRVRCVGNLTLSASTLKIQVIYCSFSVFLISFSFFAHSH